VAQGVTDRDRVRRLNVTAAWFTEGVERRDLARRDQRCVECGVGLPSRRTPYCSRRCKWSFHGRYFWDAARRVTIRRDRFRCRACGLRYPVRELDVDHIVELAAGGRPLDPSNLQTLCRPCHRRKTAQFLRFRSAARREAGAPTIRTFDAEGPDWFPA
jgi:hypothetical protein